MKLVVTKNRMIYDLLRGMDAVATELSTVGLEAMMNRVPSVYLRKADYSNINHDYYYEEMGRYVNRDPVQLAELTYRIICDPRERAMNIARANRFLAAAYPVVLAGEAFAKLLDRLTGRSWNNPVAIRYEKRFIRGSDQRIYWVRRGKKRLIASTSALYRRGLHAVNAVTIPDKELARIPPGTVLK